ncbi:AdoMet_MTases domain containing protein [uncultured Caudovirales phage]|uniref:AdoMet_MTases domain containing protein n=1 Tax=uncultured Caudovirales phage TaxID=2100421 RepID=A0A6J7X2T0_9CAUD|nr:AdoMet_MTases domain containing protein [uncultured Caudovirales phage]
MPSFVFTSPEGKSYTVNGPEGSTAEQAWGVLQQQLSAAPAAPAPAPAGPPPAMDAMGNVTGVDGSVDPFAKQPEAQGLPGLKQAAEASKPSVLAMGEELSKGAASGVIGLKSMWENAGVMKDVGAMSTVQGRLSLFDKIDSGEITDNDQLRGLDSNTSVARSYLASGPEMREKLRDRMVGEIGNRKDFVNASIETINRYQKDAQKYRGRTTDLTDIEGAKDFANWLSFNVGSGAVQMAPIMLAAVTTGPAGVAALGTTMGVSEAVGNRLDAIMPKLEGMPPEQKAEAVIDYVKKTGDTNLAVGIVSGAFDSLLGPAAALAKRGLGQVVKGETRMQALKAGIKETPKQMGEEFIAGGAQEFTQQAGAYKEGEIDALMTRETAKKVLNAAAAEAAGSLGGSGITTAARVYGAKGPGPEEPSPAVGLESLVPALSPTPPGAAPMPTLEEQIRELMKTAETPKPEPVEPAAEATTKTPEPEAGAPASTGQDDESIDREAMLRELEEAMGEKPSEPKLVSPESKQDQNIVQPPAQEPTDGTQAPQAEQAKAQGQEPAAAANEDLTPETRANIQSGVASLDADDRALWADILQRKLEKKGSLTWQDVPQDLNSSVDTVAFSGIKEGIAANPQQAIDLIRGAKETQAPTAAAVKQAKAQGQEPAAAAEPVTQKGGAKRVTPVENGTVDTWYDRPTRSWVTQRLDAEGNQIGDASYDGTQEDAKRSHASMVSDAKPAPVTKPINTSSERVDASDKPQRYEYPTPFPNQPAYIQPAQNAVVDFMNGDIEKDSLLQRFVDLDLTEAQIRSVTNRIDITKGEIDSVAAMRAAKGKPATQTEASLESMFDDVLAEEAGKKEPTKTERVTEGRGAEGRTTTQAAKSAAKNTAEGFANAIDGLGKLFGQGPNEDGTTNLNSGIPVKINEETYKKAKPLFQAAVANFQQAGADIREVMRAVIRAVLDKFGKDATENMKPYIIRFVSEYQGEQVAPAADENQTTIESIRDHLLNGGSFSTIVEARKFIEGITGNKIEPGTMQAKQADEMIEAGVVMSARQMIADGRKDGLQSQTIYEQLVDLYDRQPSLNVRSSTSVANQAYSTPAPLAFVASELAGINDKTSVYEPAGGNGMLLIGANPKLVTANELNEDRFKTLQRLYPEATVTQGNALDNGPGKTFDVVIENPPFGKVGDISNIDHEIAMESLLEMDDDGRAVLLLGGVQATTEDGRRDGYRGKAKREFYYELYNKYNVVDHFTVGGDMYSKQGTTFPVDVIVIDGIGKSQRDLPAADLPQMITSYEQLKEKLNDRLVSGQDSGTSRTDGGVSETGEAGREDVDIGAGGPGGEPGTTRREPTGGGGTGVQGNEPATGGRREPAGGRTGNAQPGADDVSERGPAGGSVASASKAAGRGERVGEKRGPSDLGAVSAVSGERVGSGLKDRAGLEQETAGQVGYSPFSSANSVGTLVPRAMADAINNSLATLEAAVGSIDEYVATSLEMDPETVRELLSAEQIDALALAIRNAEAGKGFIIGDQTGVGKGRVVASMIRYALVNDKVPIFVTDKPNLYSDMIRDLDDIGMTDALGLDVAKTKVLITNNDEKIPYTLVRDVDGEVIETELTLGAPGSKAKNKASLDDILRGMRESDSLGDYKVVFTTYTQLQTIKGGQDTERRRFVKHFGAGNYMIFDESHNAGGSGETQARTKDQREKAKEGKSLATGRAAFIRELVQNAYGTFFSSATYAKKPEVMDLYSSTDMKLAVNNLNELADAIKNGGIPMQQTVANMLAQAGQYIRRERTFAGVSYDTQDTKVDKATAENMATSMRKILEFSRAKEMVVKGIQKELDKQGKKIAGGPTEKIDVQGANFGSIMHNLIDQMLLSLKVQSSVDHAIERLKAGEKVVMTVANTMGSFLKDYSNEMGLSIGDQVDLSFKDMYLRYLEKQRIIKIKPPGKNSVVIEQRLTDESLGPVLTKQFNDIKAFIESAGFGSAPISPIDYLHAELNKAGYKTEEITGRTVTVNYSSGKPILSSRSSNVSRRVKSVRAFNDGTSDVIILNQAGSTGLSLHASSKFEDRRKRHMIIIQPEKNIDTHMQMLGRVHRTGQVSEGPLDPAARKSIASRGRMLRASERRVNAAKGKGDWKSEAAAKRALERVREEVESEGGKLTGTSGTYKGLPASYGMPAYSQMMADIPAEMRPAAVLLKKMASLNANTTGSRKSAVSAEGAVDFMNDYGGQVVHEYLRDNPEVYQAIGGKKVLEISDDPSEAGEEDIRKVTGCIPILPIKQQEEIYKDLIERYNDLIQREDSLGTNKLEAKAVDLGAKTIESKPITEDKQDESNSTSVFAKAAYMERVDVKRTVKPYSKNEVREMVEENLGGKSAYEAGTEMLRGLKDRVTEYGRAQVADMQALPEPDQIKIENFKSQLQAQYNHASTVIKTFPMGTPVSIKNNNGVFIYGVVADIQSKGKTKSPVAGSDLKMTLALANGDAKSISLTFSQIGSTYTLKEEQEIQWLNPETLKGERIPLMDLFDKGATVRREKRWMVTGNILAGFAAVNNTGQIMTYTKDDGTTAQGVLMPRTFDFERQQKNAPVKLKSVDEVMAFFKKFGPKSAVNTVDAVFTISYRGGNQYMFTATGTKREGGKFFLDADLIKIVGEFVGSGSKPKSTMVYSQDEAERAIQYLLRDRGETLKALTNKDEARAAFQVPLSNIEQDYNQQLLSPIMAAEGDREELIRKFQSARQQRAAIVRKFMTGAAGLKEQAKLTELTEVADSLKAAIQETKEPRRSAKNFLADATAQWDQGNISDAVYSVIKDVYEKFPFVLESLKLSVRKGKDGSAAGQYSPLARFVYLYKGTTGVENPGTIRHELVHSLEQMMSEDATADLIEAWRKSLVKKMESDKSPRAQAFFDKLMAFYDKPTQESYEIALEALPSYDYYQYMNPSEYWAVNAEPLMARKLGSGWDRFVLAVKKLFEGTKKIFGFDNKYAVHKVFDQVMSGKQERVGHAALVNYVTSQKVLLENQNVRRNYKGGAAPLATWTSAEESKMDTWIYRIQDKHIDTKRVVQAITQEIGDIADRWDPYLKETLYHSRTADQTKRFLKDEFQPLMKDMAERKVVLQDFETYLHMRNAQAYNEMIASRNPEMPDGGSGIDTADAQDYLAKLTKDQKKNYEELAAGIDKIVRGTQDILVDTGMEKAETIAAWNQKLPNYVPMKRDENELDFVSSGSGMGAGFSSGGRFTKTAAGSYKTVVDIIGNIALQRERAIIRSEKARVGRALYGLAIRSPNPEFWMPINPSAIKSKKKLVQELKNMGIDPADAENIISEPKVPRFNKQTGQIEYEINPNMRGANNVLSVRVNGEDRFVFFNPGDPRAKRMIEAMKNLDAHQMSEILNGVAEATRAFAAMNTQYNPVFGAWNFVRDVMGAAVNLSSTPLAHRKAAVLAGVNLLTGAPALRAIYRDLREKGSTTPEMQKWIDLFEQFQKAGGQTGYREQFSRSKERATIVQRELGKLDRSNVRKAVDATFQWLSDYNDAMENAVRLSAFKVALDEGMSEERAASLAKNLTVNFNRKGQLTSNVNALYAFFNASVQGTARMAELLVDRTPDGRYKLSSAGKKVIVGGLLIGVAQAALLAIAGFGDDEPPDFLKDKNLILPDIFTGSGKYLVVPMPLGLNIFPNFGRIMTEFMFSGKKDAGKLGLRLLGVVMDAFNPLGTSGLAQTISPTILDPIVSYRINEDAFGRPIARESRATNPTPGYERNRETSSAFSQGLSYAINYMTGGGEYGIGKWSPTADQLDYLIGQYAGGVGREGAKLANWSADKIQGKETPPYSVPLIGKAYGETETPSAITDKFYKNVIMLAEHEGAIKRMREAKVSVSEYRRENPEVKLISTANNLENQVSKLNKTKKELLEKEQTDAVKARIKLIDEQKARMMKRFNERVKAARQ